MNTTAEHPNVEPLPALYEHCVNAYKAMLAESRVVLPDAKEGDDEVRDSDDSLVVYEGFLTQLITGKLNLSTPYYTHVRTMLLQMGCVRQLRRGGGSAPSQWEMITEPTSDLFRGAEVPKKAKEPSKYAATQEQILHLSARLSKLEGLVDSVLEALTELLGAEPAPSAQTTEENIDG